MRKRLIVSVLALIIFSTIYIMMNSFGVFNKSYKSIDLAIENSELRGNEVIVKLESNDCVYALIGKDGNSQWEYFYKDKYGWQYIFGKINIPRKLILKRNYDLIYKRYRGKDIINIHIDSQYSDIWKVRDSVNSSFKVYADSDGKEYFIALDKLPENYIIYIGDNVYKIN
ncbi:MAG: hypothetical protein PHQ32_06360 [Firmicutes bacterium]|nr:hypothetical protein [Bacillota bacterium]